jgi:hypothetical protein
VYADQLHHECFFAWLHSGYHFVSLLSPQMQT